MSNQLKVAIKEYQDAFIALPKYMEVGWIDDHQKRQFRYIAAMNSLLLMAGQERLDE